MRILVCGGRDYSDTAALYHVLDGIRSEQLMRDDPVERVIEGGATGADLRAAEWARDRKIPCSQFNADWVAHGQGAGPIRNQKMIDEGKPDLVVAFPGGKGTADMVARAKRSGIRVHETGGGI